jgi:putative acetyltransferase
VTSDAIIRPEAASDIGAVRELVGQAFGQPDEAELVERLRADGDLALALVATGGGSIVGHAAFPRLHVETAGVQVPAIGLAPLAVNEAHRRQGIGARLVRAGLAQLAMQGETLAFVLGEPAFYTRFGFSLETARPFTCAYAGPHFMAMRLSEAAPRAGTIRYPAGFDALG